VGYRLGLVRLGSEIFLGQFNQVTSNGIFDQAAIFKYFQFIGKIKWNSVNPPLSF
jgi:hypothetical protein